MNTNLVAIQMELTNACKLACAECPRYLMSRPVGVMDLDLAKGIVLDGLEMRHDMGFNVNGLGEPLLYPHFADLIDFMAQHGATRIDLFTSLIAPRRLLEKAFEAISRNPSLKIQLAITKHLYDGNGKRQFDDATFDDGFEMAMALPDEHVEKHIGAVLTKYHTVRDIVDFTERYKPRFKDGFFHIIKSLNPWFNLVKDMASVEYGASPPSLGKNICDYPFILLHVGWNGDVIVCCTDDVDGECVLGKIEKRGDVQSIWENEKFLELRRKHNEYIIDMAPCDKCERTAWARIPQSTEAT